MWTSHHFWLRGDWRPGQAARAALLVAVLCVLAGALGCSSQSPTSMVVTSPPSTAPPSASVAFCDTPNPGCPGASSFSLKSLGDLSVIVNWSHVPAGNHVQTLRFLLPGGNVYQATETGFATAPQSSGSATMVHSLPVAGTFINQRQLTGTWTVDVLLDGKPIASQTVRLDP